MALNAAVGRRIHDTYTQLSIDRTVRNDPVVRWQPPQPASAYARRTAEKEWLETTQYLEDEEVPADLNDLSRPAIVARNVALQERRATAVLCLANHYQGMNSMEALDRELNDMQVMASGSVGREAMRADEEALDIIPCPKFGNNPILNQGSRKNFLAAISNTTYQGGKTAPHESNVLVMILTCLKNAIELDGLHESAAMQLTMACFRGEALDLFMIHRRQPKGYMTFWSLVQALSKVQISPTEAIQRISKLKQTRIPSQGIAGVISELIRLNHFTLPANQPKHERDEQYKTSVLRDLRDVVQCLYPSFTNQVTFKEREAKAANEAQKAQLRNAGNHAAADMVENDPISCLVHAMINILHVESEGTRIQFESLDEVMKGSNRGLHGNQRFARNDRQSRNPRFSAVSEVLHLPKVQSMRADNNRTRQPPRQQQARPPQGGQRQSGGNGRAQERTYPKCKKCGKHHQDVCNRYKRSAAYPCVKCQAANVELFHLAEECNQHLGYSTFANKPNERQISAVTGQRRPQQPQRNRQGGQGNQYQQYQPDRRGQQGGQRNGGRPANANGQRGPSINAKFERRGQQPRPRVNAVTATPRRKAEDNAEQQQ